MMTLRRFRALADAYGAELQRWPEDQRAEAALLLHGSAQARLVLAEAQTLDLAIRGASAREDAMLWPPGGRDAALARVRAGVAAQLASSPGRRPWRVSSGWALTGLLSWPTSLPHGWVGMMTGGSFAIAAGLLIGALYMPVSAPHNLLTMLQPSPIQFLVD